MGRAKNKRDVAVSPRSLVLKLDSSRKVALYQSNVQRALSSYSEVR